MRSLVPFALALVVLASPPAVARDGQGWERLYRWCRAHVLTTYRQNDVKAGRSQLHEIFALRHITTCFETGGRVR